MRFIRRQTLFYLTILVFSLLFRPVSGQIIDDMKDDFTHFRDMSGEIGENIIKPDRHDINIFLIGSAAAIMTMLIDDPVRDLAQKNQNSFLDGVFKIDDYYGSRKYTPLAVLALYGSGLVIGNTQMREMGLHSIEAFTYTAIITAVLKESFGRSRPYREDGPWHYKPFAFTESRRAFPSGHASLTFAISTVMAHEIDHPLWKTGWYGAAVLVSLARVYHDQHWASDILVGALIGHAVGRFVSNKSDEWDTDKTQFYPAPTSSGWQFHFSIPLR